MGTITIEKNHTIIDGAGHLIQGSGEEDGLLVNASYVTVRDIIVEGFTYAIHLKSAYKCVVTGCATAKNALDGIKLEDSYGNFILNNTITNNGDDGVQLFNSGNNSVAGNRILNNDLGIQINGQGGFSENNTVEGNFIEGHWKGIVLSKGSAQTKVVYNTITGCYDKAKFGCGIELWYSSGNVIHHNNFVNNTNEVFLFEEFGDDFWDDGVEGNFWSNYTGVDTNEDGVGDTPYSDYNYYEAKMIQFDYPLMSEVNIEGIEFTPPNFRLIEPSFDSQDETQSPPTGDFFWIGLAVESALVIALLAATITILKSKRQKKKGSQL